ncbi:basic salivary proline-rich protein 1-like [Pungitius pungitius]|uniref:basic salivary proline-rich protein 1-like n=1 Tax=Pungitius pungitius TaxID=134920 RepID=UPI002E160306
MSINMLTSRGVVGVSIFVLLIVDICCFSYNQGSNPSASHGSHYSSAASAVHADQGGQSVVWPPKVPKGVIMQHNPSEPHVGPGISKPTAQRGPAPSVGLSSSSGPISSGFRDTSVRKIPAISAQPGAAFQPGPQNIPSAPPNPPSGGEGMSSGIRDVAPSFPEAVSPIEPQYKAGELSQFDRTFDYGNNERETEQQGGQPQPPPPPFIAQESAGQGFAGPPQPVPNPGYGVDFLPFPYDYMFLTGQYPPGTFIHTSSSYDHGRDFWEDVRYERPGREQPVAPVAGFQSPQRIKGPNPLMAGYRPVGGKVGPASSHGGFRQPAGGRNQVKGAY